MITFPNAKINLGLNVVRRRPDGYHDIETAFYPIPLTDVLEIVPAGGGETTLTCHGQTVDCPAQDNLVMRAHALMQRHYGVPPVEMHLYKHIPHGAGLGGGSSDAAHAITMLNDLFGLNRPQDELARLAAQLGADCAFFVYNRPMLATGVGDVLSPIDVSLQGMTLLLVKPEAGVSTAQAYSRVTPAPPQTDLRQTLAMPVAAWDGWLKNDFEPSVFAQIPQLLAIKTALYAMGAHYAAMSGSGSTVFGIFDNDKLSAGATDTFADYATFVLKL